MSKHALLKYTSVILLLFMILYPSQGLLNQCGIKFCASCDPNTNFCNQCELPYKPGYANQSVCTRCANNCAVCQTQGTDSKGRCLSCQPNFDYSKDDHCDTFQIWIYVVVIAAYVVFIITLFIIFCYIKRRKEKQQNSWFQKLKLSLNKVDTQKITVLQFEKMCEYLTQLLKESSSYNNLKFRDREYEKAMKLKKVEMKTIETQTHMKKIRMRGFDNSEWQGHGYVFIPKDDKSKMKLWFAKNYKRRVFSESISKVIIYESESIETNIIKGRWYYYGSPQIGGDWKGVKQLPDNRVEQQMNLPY